MRALKRHLLEACFRGVLGLFSIFVNCLGGFMRPLKRHHVNKHSSARRFRGHSSRTKAMNMRLAPMRGGIRA